jgi:hypothetical protein
LVIKIDRSLDDMPHEQAKPSPPVNDLVTQGGGFDGRLPKMGDDQPGTPPSTWEAPMTTFTHFQRPTVAEMSQAEWTAAVRRALERLHITYEQLEEMARRRDFTSLDAKKLWLVVGEQGEGRPRAAD